MIAAAAKTPDAQPDSSPLPPKAAAHGKRPLNICIASPEFIGPAHHGSTGIAFTAMAQALTAAGHQVTCLFLGAKDPSSHAWERWVDKYKRDGLTLIALPQINASELVAPSNLIKSYETYHWLKRNDRFDIIHFPDRQGPGYHTLTAKHHGMAFANTTICVGLHSMTAWLKPAGQESPNVSGEVDTEFMERRAVALADAVVSPSHYLLNWISDRHWAMPRQRYVRQNILPHSAWPAAPPVAPRLHEITELVYFGTLETRKGIVLFCDALDSLPSPIAKKILTVTFLGRESAIDGIPARAYVQKRAQHWPFPFQLITGQDRPATMDYLRQKNRLAVIPSLLDNSPYSVLECLGARIAFVASRVGGIPELIAPADLSKVCFEPNAGALGAILCATLTEGIRPARAVLDVRANEQAWIALHENSLARPNPDVQPPLHRASPALPPTAPCPASLNRPEVLEQDSADELPELSTKTARAAIQALSINPADAIALKTLARIHLDAGLHEAAQEACQLILTSNPQDAEALQMLEEAMIQEAKLAENLVETGSIPRPPQHSRSPEPFQTIAAALTSPFACP